MDQNPGPAGDEKFGSMKDDFIRRESTIPQFDADDLEKEGDIPDSEEKAQEPWVEEEEVKLLSQPSEVSDAIPPNPEDDKARQGMDMPDEENKEQWEARLKKAEALKEEGNKVFKKAMKE